MEKLYWTRTRRADISVWYNDGFIDVEIDAGKENYVDIRLTKEQVHGLINALTRGEKRIKLYEKAKQ